MAAYTPQEPTHSGIMGLKLEERLKALGVDVVLACAGRTAKGPREFLRESRKVI